MRSLMACGVVVAGVACGVEGPADGHNVWHGEGGTRPGTTSGPATGASAVTSTSGAAASVTSAATSSSAGGGAETEGCAPEPDDGACIGCLKQACCAEIEACLIDGVCACWAGCLQGTSDCLGCGVPNGLLEQLLICAEGCQLECGFTEPA